MNQATIYYCDNCNSEEESGELPEGWYMLTYGSEERHFCSLRCFWVAMTEGYKVEEVSEVLTICRRQKDAERERD